MERWDEAAIAITAALDKGGFSERKTGDAYVLQGMSEFNLGNYNKASTAWGRASKYPKARKVRPAMDEPYARGAGQALMKQEPLIERFLDNLWAERGLSDNSLQSYRHDLLHLQDRLAGRGKALKSRHP